MIVGGGGSPRRLADCIVCNTRVARSACADDPGTTAVPAGLLLAAVVVMATAAEDGGAVELDEDAIADAVRVSNRIPRL